MPTTESDWILPKRKPNYFINIDLDYPYSECPYLGKYKLLKIPETGLIEHIDYWGEGLVDVHAGISGFSDCYNINHEFQLVSNGAQGVVHLRIPNRIPVPNYEDCNTSSYIIDDSVKIVTLMGAPINKSCGIDIARMVNHEKGLVVLYGFDRNDRDVKNVEGELNMKGIIFCPRYRLPKKLQSITLIKTYLAFLNSTEYADILYRSIVDADYDYAVSLTEELTKANQQDVVSSVMGRVPRGNHVATMTFARHLRSSGYDDVVSSHFPSEFHNA